MAKTYEGRFGIRPSTKLDGTVELIIAAKDDGEFTAADAEAAYKKLLALSKAKGIPARIYSPPAPPKAKRVPVVLHKYGKPYMALLVNDDSKIKSKRKATEWL